MADDDEWYPRVENIEEVPHYDDPDRFTMKIYHGGYIHPRLSKYVMGKISYYDNCNKDKMSLIELDGMVKGINPAYVGTRIDYWYSIGSEADAMTKLQTDADALMMCCSVPNVRLIILYLDHRELDPDYDEELDAWMIGQQPAFSQHRSSKVVIEELPDIPRRQRSSMKIKEPRASPKRPKKPLLLTWQNEPILKKGMSGIKIAESAEEVPTQSSRAPSQILEQLVNGKGKKLMQDGPAKDSSDSEAKFGEVRIARFGGMHSGGESAGLERDDDFVDGGLEEVGELVNGNLGGDGDVDNGLEGFDDRWSSEAESKDGGGEEELVDDDCVDDEYDPTKDDEEYAGYGVDDDFLFDWICEDEVPAAVGDEEGTNVATEGKRIEETDDGADDDNEDFVGAIHSDEEVIGHEHHSGDEGHGPKYPEFNPKVDMKNPVFVCGMLFGSKQILRDAVREMAIQNGWTPLWIKNDKDRCRVICRANDCDFELHASKMQKVNTFQIKTYQEQHSCLRVNGRNPAVRVLYLVERFADFVKLNPDISIVSLQNTMTSHVKAKVSFQQAYRTKTTCLDMIKTSYKEQYARIHDYALEMRRADPETTVDIKCEFTNLEGPMLNRMYICLGAFKRAFKSGCRPILGLDGCHLKSAFGGQLLSAVGIDANNCTYVVAYAQVEMENKDSWLWFLDLLEKDLGIKEDGNGFTFISDKQKGLIPAVEESLPLADHRFCVRHLWTNFNKLFSGKAFKDQLWAVAKATTLAYYTKEMALMRQMDPAAHAWLTDPEDPTRHPRHWCRSHFRTFLKCDVLLNNACESFNSFILPCRSKAIISCFEEMRVKLMKRIAARKEKMSKRKDPICPKPREILERNKMKANTDCIPNATGSQVIEVESIGGSKYVVDVKGRTCACRRWDLTGIPCKHAISAMYFLRLVPEDFVDPCYLTSTYMSTYLHTVAPLNEMDLWMSSGETAIIPPQYNRQPGQPRTKRIRDAAERATDGTKLPRNRKTVRCTNCGTFSHNRTTCHRHLPARTNAATNAATNVTKKRKARSDPKCPKSPPKTKNHLREKAEQTRKTEKENRQIARAAAKAAAKAAGAPVVGRGRPPKSPVVQTTVPAHAPTNATVASTSAPVSATTSSQASSRSSKRIRGNAKTQKK